jgi:hypothetical protein
LRCFNGLGHPHLLLLLPVAVALIAGCAASPVDESEATQGERLVRQTALPARPTVASQGADRLFEAPRIRVSLAPAGAWSLRTEVTHPRLRCGSYATRVRFGTGNADCSRVEWLTPVSIGPARRQCNGATLVHSDSGSLSLVPEQMRRLNCAEVAVQCTGACG